MDITELELRVLQQLKDTLRKVDEPEHHLPPNHRSGDIPTPHWGKCRAANGDYPAHVTTISLPAQARITKDMLDEELTQFKPRSYEQLVRDDKASEYLEVGVAKPKAGDRSAYLTVTQFSRGFEQHGFAKMKSDELDFSALFKEIADNAGLRVMHDLQGVPVRDKELFVSRKATDHVTQDTGSMHKGYIQIESRAEFPDTKENRAQLLAAIEASITRRAPKRAAPLEKILAATPGENAYLRAAKGLGGLSDISRN